MDIPQKVIAFSANNVTFAEKMNIILETIGIPTEEGRNEIVQQIGYNNLQHEMINVLTEDNVRNLLVADEQLHRAFDQIPQDRRVPVQNSWNLMKRKLGELQGLILLKKIRNNDCEGAINAILGAVTAKTEAVNNILKAELNTQAGGGDDDLRYRAKYLKYKAKYLNLSQK